VSKEGSAEAERVAAPRWIEGETGSRSGGVDGQEKKRLTERERHLDKLDLLQHVVSVGELA
jgi:hypothetical protein